MSDLRDRWYIWVGDDPSTAKPVLSPFGSPIWYDNHDEAADAARRLIKDAGMPGVFLAKMHVIAFYLPVTHEGTVYVDETRLDGGALDGGN